ncbi:hypothetical protein O181_005714 [Austropuccinia psidii MF-1]|uniref:GH16 domain-containing protein n=1 Tax=Austropuccinia psidii MF-1 TaxID=1389203 RepID=A0A9Q3GG52_9BASI|nr:hypothetical protein [Austropuccinia psidii MF-1]
MRSFHHFLLFFIGLNIAHVYSFNSFHYPGLQKSPRNWRKFQARALNRQQAPLPKTPKGSSSSKSICQPRLDRFTTPVSAAGSSWRALSTRRDSYQMTPGGGAELILNPPQGVVKVSADGKVNDKLGDGSTFNSTFSLLYGKVTVTMTAAPVPGAVTALVLMGTKTMDEIDVEILGGDPTHWQTNVFRPAPKETEPLYGVFGGVESYPKNGVVGQTHTYVVDWSPKQIVWSVDGQVVRTLTPAQTLHNGAEHYPSALSRIQLGLWDASNPLGTSDWAKGPIPWSKLKGKPIKALVKSVQVECPY